MVALAAASARPDVVYAGNTNGIHREGYRSSDGGETWSETAYGLEEGDTPWVVAVDPTAPDTVYVGTVNGESPSAAGELRGDQSGGVYKTVDGGASWTPLSIGLRSRRSSRRSRLTLRSRERSTRAPQDAECSRAAKAASGGIVREPGFRLRRGSTGPCTASPSTRRAPVSTRPRPWAPPRARTAARRGRSKGGSSSAELSTVVADTTRPGTLLAGSLDHGMLRSTDWGEHWQSANAGLSALLVMGIAVDPATPRSVFLGTYEWGLVVTADGGRTWSQIAGLKRPANGALAISWVLTALSTSGTRRSPSCEASMEGRPGGAASLPDYAYAHTLVVDPRRPSRVYAGTDEGVLVSVNRGASWRRTGKGSRFARSLRSIRRDPRTSTPPTEDEPTEAWPPPRTEARPGSGSPTGLRHGAGVRSLAVGSKTGVVFASAQSHRPVRPQRRRRRRCLPPRARRPALDSHRSRAAPRCRGKARWPPVDRRPPRAPAPPTSARTSGSTGLRVRTAPGAGGSPTRCSPARPCAGSPSRATAPACTQRSRAAPASVRRI